MWITKQYFINRDLALSFSISVKNFTETRSPSHAWGNSTIPYSRIFKVRVKMYMRLLAVRSHGIVVIASIRKRKGFPHSSDFHWFSVNHSRPSKTDPGFEFSMSNCPDTFETYHNISVLPSNALLTRWQTNRQTNLFNFVRPSFQSMENSHSWDHFWDMYFLVGGSQSGVK